LAADCLLARLILAELQLPLHPTPAPAPTEALALGDMTSFGIEPIQ
jgi:hypothetical protein